MDGYWEQPEETGRRSMAAGSIPATAARSTRSGYLTILDRKKDVIITGGENVSSIEVEDCLFAHPDVAEVAVIGVPDEKWGETVKALVVVAPGAAVTEEEIMSTAGNDWPRYKAPTQVEFRSELARTATGQTAEVQAARALLGGPGAVGQLTASRAPQHVRRTVPHRSRRHARSARRAARATPCSGSAHTTSGGFSTHRAAPRPCTCS